MLKIQKSILKCMMRILTGITILSSICNSTFAQAMNSDEMRLIEEEIFNASAETQSKLEIKIARYLQKDASSIEANYLMSTLLLKMFTFDPGSYALIRQSTELAAQIYELDKKNELAIAALANILEVSGESSRGLALIKEATKRGTRLGWRSRISQARLLYNEKNYVDALKILEQNLSDPDLSKELQSNIVLDIVNEHFSGSSQTKALELWKEKLQTINLKLAYAASLAISDKLNEAKSEYETVIKQFPGNSEALLSLGLIEQRISKNSTHSEKLLRSAITFAKNSNERNAAQTHLALLLISQKTNSFDANDATVNAIRDANDREGVLVALASSHLRHSKTSAILDLLERIEKDVPGLSLAHAIKGEVLSEKLGLHDDARISFSNAISLDKSRSEYYNGRGLSLMQMGQMEDALKDFETATVVNPDDASSRYNFACALARLGRKKEALNSLSLAVSMDSKLSSYAQEDSDFTVLRSESEFQSIIFSEKPFSVGH